MGKHRQVSSDFDEQGTHFPVKQSKVNRSIKYGFDFKVEFVLNARNHRLWHVN